MGGEAIIFLASRGLSRLLLEEAESVGSSFPGAPQHFY